MMEDRDPAKEAAQHLSPEGFRFGMRRLAAAVCVITAQSDGVRGGLTATAVMSLSADPPRLAVAVNKTASAYPLIAKARSFAVNVLRYEQLPIASRFAGACKGEARFAHAQWAALQTGAPALVDAAATFDCTLHQAIDAGTHVLLIGDVRALASSSAQRPLLYCDGQWASLGERAERAN